MLMSETDHWEGCACGAMFEDLIYSRKAQYNGAGVRLDAGGYLASYCFEQAVDPRCQVLRIGIRQQTSTSELPWDSVYAQHTLLGAYLTENIWLANQKSHTTQCRSSSVGLLKYR
jgi:hypothetical protein